MREWLPEGFKWNMRIVMINIFSSNALPSQLFISTAEWTRWKWNDGDYYFFVCGVKCSLKPNFLVSFDGQRMITLMVVIKLVWWFVDPRRPIKCHPGWKKSFWSLCRGCYAWSDLSTILATRLRVTLQETEMGEGTGEVGQSMAWALALGECEINTKFIFIEFINYFGDIF